MADKEIKKVLSAYSKETKRHFDVVAEDIKDQIKIVSEQVAANTEKLTEHDKEFTDIKETLNIVKLDIELIKNDLKQKVSREEFVVLEKRVSLLETKSRR